MPEGLTCHLIFAAMAAALGSGFQHGYHTGVINTPSDIIKAWYTYDVIVVKREKEPPSEKTVDAIWTWIVALMCVGGCIGGLLISVFADKMGRKMGLIYNNIFATVAVSLMSFSYWAKSYEMILVGRLFIGVNCGLNAGIAPMYLSEISPQNLRGALGSIYQLYITVFILVSQILSIDALLGTPTLWPILFSLAGFPIVIQVLMFIFCPESPKFLLCHKGNMEKASQSLAWLRNKKDVSEVEDEVATMKAEDDAIKALPQLTVKDLFRQSALRKPLGIAVVLMIAQQFSGINAIMFYSTRIFEEQIGLDKDEANYATIGVGTINVIMTILALYLVEKFGRKTLLLVGFSGLAVTTALMTLFLALKDQMGQTASGYICTVLIYLYIVFFAPGCGPIPWFLVSELFNVSARPPATAIAVFVNWFCNTIVGLTFPYLVDWMDQYVFLIFTGLNTLFVVFIFFKVPETRNKPIEEITALFT